jgi:hypothetical protein
LISTVAFEPRLTVFATAVSMPDARAGHCERKRSFRRAETASSASPHIVEHRHHQRAEMADRVGAAIAHHARRLPWRAGAE